MNHLLKYTRIISILLMSSLTIAGCSNNAPNDIEVDQVPDPALATLDVKQEFERSILFTSPVFNEKKRIPKKHTCTKISANEPNISPPLAWEGAPDGVRSFAVIMDSLEGVADEERSPLGYLEPSNRSA